MEQTPVTSPLTRSAALAGPALFAVYAVTRDVDGWNGTRGEDAWWTLGHLAFLASTLALAALVVQLLRDVRRREHRALTWAAAAATTVALVGAALLCWVLLMDLDVAVAEPPDAVVLGGPVLLGVGLVALLLPQVGRGLPLWSPPTFLVADAAVGFDLDLATPAGLVMTVALWPLVRRPAARGARVPAAG